MSASPENDGDIDELLLRAQVNYARAQRIERLSVRAFSLGFVLALLTTASMAIGLSTARHSPVGVLILIIPTALPLWGIWHLVAVRRWAQQCRNDLSVALQMHLEQTTRSHQREKENLAGESPSGKGGV